MKNLIAIALIASLTGCGWFDRKITANLTGWSQTCVKGLSVIQMASGAFYELDANGKPVKCN